MRKIFLISIILILAFAQGKAGKTNLYIFRNLTFSSFDDDPAKNAKKQAKKLKKDGWTVTVGHPDVETQLIQAAKYENEMMNDGKGGKINRYIMQTAMQTARSYNAAFSSARTAAQAEVAAVLKTRIKAAMIKTIESKQTSTINASTVDAFNEKAEAIVDETLKNSKPVINIFRNLPNQTVEVQIRLAFDRTEIAEDVKSNMMHQLNIGSGTEADQILCGLVDESINQTF